jgi:hypothetical protein
VRDALTDHRIVGCVSLWDMCLCCGPSRTSVDHVRSYAPPSPVRGWSFGFKLSFRPLAFRVYLCLCVHAFACALLQLRQWACLSHALTNRSTVRFSFSAATAPAHALRAPLLPSSPLLVLTLAHRSSHIDGRATGRLVPAHTHPHCVLGPSRFLQVTDGFVLSRGSSAAQQNGCAIPCCHPLFIPLVVCASSVLLLLPP